MHEEPFVLFLIWIDDFRWSWLWAVASRTNGVASASSWDFFLSRRLNTNCTARAIEQLSNKAACCACHPFFIVWLSIDVESLTIFSIKSLVGLIVKKRSCYNVFDDGGRVNRKRLPLRLVIAACFCRYWTKNQCWHLDTLQKNRPLAIYVSSRVQFFCGITVKWWPLALCIVYLAVHSSILTNQDDASICYSHCVSSWKAVTRQPSPKSALPTDGTEDYYFDHILGISASVITVACKNCFPNHFRRPGKMAFHLSNVHLLGSFNQA